MLKSIAIAAILGLAFLTFACAITARADGYFWDDSHHPRRVVHRRSKKPALRYYAAPAEDEWNEPSVRCIDKKVEVVSTEHTNVENAKEAGRKILMATIQWRYGGAYMNLDLAEDYREYCGPSSAMDTASGRISEAANKLVGQDGQNVRCVLRALPCRARLEKAEGHR